MARDVKLRIMGIDLATPVFNKITKNLGQFQRQTERLGSAFGGMAKLTAPLAGIFAGAGAAFLAVGKSVVETAANYDELTNSLISLEGSSEKAKTSLLWAGQFAAKNGLGIEQTTAAFTKLRVAGLAPMKNGLFESIGNAAIVAKKTIDEAADAVIEAVDGKTKKLGDLGIESELVGDKIVFSFEDKFGKRIKAAADKNNREMIQTAVTTIWNEKYSGAMDRHAQGWSGMVERLKGYWHTFQMRIAGGGLWENIKTKFATLLTWIENNQPKLNALADKISGLLKKGFESLVKFVEKIDLDKVVNGFADVIEQGYKLFNLMGGLNGIAVIAGVVWGTGFVSSLISAVGAIIQIGKMIQWATGLQAAWNLVMNLNPAIAGLTVMTAAFAGLVALIKQATENWQLFKDVWGDTGKNFTEFWGKKLGFGSDAPRNDLANSMVGRPSFAEGLVGPMGAVTQSTTQTAEVVIKTTGLPDFMRVETKADKGLNLTTKRGGLLQ